MHGLVEPFHHSGIWVRTHTFLGQNPHSLGSEPTPVWVRTHIPSVNRNPAVPALNRNLLPSIKPGLVNGGFPLFEALDPISMALGSDLVAIGAHHGVCK
jgi:hypothetical protein